MTTLYPSEALVAESTFFPSDSTPFKFEWDAAISNYTSYCYKNGQDISSDMLSGSDSILGAMIQVTKTLTIRDEDAGSYLLLEGRVTIQGKTRNNRLMIYVPTYEEGPFVDEIVSFPNNAEPYVHVWNSAARITAASTRVYKNGQEISDDVLSGSDSFSANVQTGQILTPRLQDAGDILVYECRATIESRVFNRRLKVIVPELI